MQEQNPYAAPTSLPDVTSTPGYRDGLSLASQTKRFLNFIIDNVFCQVMSGAVGVVFGIARASSGQQVTEADLAGLQLALVVVGIGLVITYFVFCEALFGRTVGKMITGTKVVSTDGSGPTFGQVLGRSFARMIPFEPLSFFGGKGFPVGWHDSLAGTRVVNTR